MSSFKFYQHDADIYYTNRYYKKVQSIRKSIAQSAISHDKISELFQIITDFDRTLTHPLSFQCHGLIAEFVPIPEFQSAVKPLFNFRALYPNVPPQKWWEMFHEEMVKHNITPSILSQLLAVPGRVYLREHCQELFQFCLDRDIPILIVSAGITNLIISFLQRHGLSQSQYPNVNILANTIHWKHTESEEKENGLQANESTESTDNTVISHFGPLLSSFNKADTFQYLKNGYFMRENVKGRKFVIFMGDSRTDPDTMKNIEGVEQCIFIGFILPHRFHEIGIFMEHYDVVIATKNASLEFVHGLLDALMREEEVDMIRNGIDCHSDTVSEIQTVKQPMQKKSTFTHSFSNLKLNENNAKVEHS